MLPKRPPPQRQTQKWFTSVYTESELLLSAEDTLCYTADQCPLGDPRLCLLGSSVAKHIHFSAFRVNFMVTHKRPRGERDGPWSLAVCGLLVAGQTSKQLLIGHQHVIVYDSTITYKYVWYYPPDRFVCLLVSSVTRNLAEQKSRHETITTDNITTAEEITALPAS